MLKIFEIYKSLQGESSYTGFPCTFIRLSGCPLRCTWCDSEYAFVGGEDKSIDEIISEVAKNANKLVLVTGGEPLAQPHINELLEVLIKQNYIVMIETSGSFSIAQLPKEVIAIVDVKCPGSQMSDKMHWQNLSLLRPQDEVKFVVINKNDFLWACDIVEKYNLINRVIISPVFDVCDIKDLADWLIESGKEFYLQTQMHKIIWGSKAIGV